MCAYKTRVRCETARQLIIMADMLAADLSYSADDSRSIIRRLACEKALARLTFLKDMDIEIIEKHHRNKVDSPSGTALMIANNINKQNNNKYKYVFNRNTIKNRSKSYNEIGFSSVRGRKFNR